MKKRPGCIVLFAAWGIALVWAIFYGSIGLQIMQALEPLLAAFGG